MDMFLQTSCILRQEVLNEPFCTTNSCTAIRGYLRITLQAIPVIERSPHSTEVRFEKDPFLFMDNSFNSRMFCLDENDTIASPQTSLYPTLRCTQVSFRSNTDISWTLGVVRTTRSLLSPVGLELIAPFAIVDSSPPSSDPPSALFSSFAMPTPAICMQMPSPDIPEMSYAYGRPDVYGQLDAYSQPNAYRQPDAYGQPNAYGQPDVYSQPNTSEHPFSFELPHAPEHLNPFHQPFEQGFDDPPHVSVSHYPSEPQLSDWVPKVEGMSQADEDPTSEPIYIHTPDPVALTPTPISRKPSRLRRVASFLGIGPKKPKVSPRS